HRRLRRANGRSKGGPGSFFAQVCFDAVKLSDLSENPVAGNGIALFGFEEFSPNVSPASGEFDRGFALLLKTAVGFVAVALQGAFEAVVDYLVDAVGSSTGMPMVNGVA
ncbi:hypothetical protein MLD52_23455, partial [Puniceicoccaceae bacterium K14]|nr:hypothetical protein [Puniceicoccaceae bacterium K14]